MPVCAQFTGKFDTLRTIVLFVYTISPFYSHPSFSFWSFGSGSFCLYVPRSSHQSNTNDQRSAKPQHAGNFFLRFRLLLVKFGVSSLRARHVHGIRLEENWSTGDSLIYRSRAWDKFCSHQCGQKKIKTTSSPF
ncbi:hypothetical protein RvY_01220 [Ramazzottius varieornatus]|uniref:Uncharacterized protein n=1 Tax=Ramazzottius varieornatus TaxID=947166 RepID=A0A1D1UMP7_RAMVA|nr:hypothetical protein RvY_01220 [Ramazzottius varieornatus]